MATSGRPAEATGPTSLGGKILFDSIDHLQEIIIKDRRARNAEHWETLKVRLLWQQLHDGAIYFPYKPISYTVGILEDVRA